jgi:hypothetical protein
MTTLLLFLEDYEQVKMGLICQRAYYETVPWNMRPILLDSPCDFPNLRISSEDQVIKRVEATIEDEEGEFFGIVCKSSGIPDGYGVFITDDWVHCGQVKYRAYQQGRKVSVKKDKELLVLVNEKCRADGTVMKKIEKFSKEGVERCL